MVDKIFFERLVECVIWAESSGKPDAVSPKGAQGLMQVMPPTAKEVMQELGLDPETWDPFDPEMNRVVGTAYLRKMFGLFGNVQLALAAYNAGPGRVSRLTQIYGDYYENIKSALPDETQKYVEKITKRLMTKGVYI